MGGVVYVALVTWSIVNGPVPETCWKYRTEYSR